LKLKPDQWEEQLLSPKTLKDETDEVIGMVTVSKNDINDSKILVVTKMVMVNVLNLMMRSEDVYRITNRGGKELKTLNITEKNRSINLDKCSY
jgi:DNA gyrase subunit A